MPEYVIDRGQPGELVVRAANAKRDEKHYRFYDTQGKLSESWPISDGGTIEPEIPNMMGDMPENE